MQLSVAVVCGKVTTALQLPASFVFVTELGQEIVGAVTSFFSTVIVQLELLFDWSLTVKVTMAEPLLLRGVLAAGL